MPLPDLTEPKGATNIATFGGDGQTPASKINYSVPLPGAQPADRVIPLNIAEDWFVDTSSDAGISLRELGIVEGDDGVVQGINRERLAALYRRLLPATARPALRSVADVGGDVEPLLEELTGGGQRALAADGETGLLERRRIVAEPDDVELQRRRKDSYIQRLAEQQTQLLPAVAVNAPPPAITVPVPGPGNCISEVLLDVIAPATPRLALVETWELRSYLGDYGLGRTLQTFSLLPGERTTITVETWRSEAATRDDATSIFDSSDTAAQTRFANALSTESGSAFQDQGGWSVSVGTSASASGSFFGIVQGSASIEAGFAANHQEASQRWSGSVSQSATDHATQANNSRRQAVQSSSSTTTQSGTATTTVREIANTNLRRVLNFVFRELNQTYDCYVVLRDIRLAFYNGRVGSAEIVPLGDLRPLLAKHVIPARQEEVARFILAMCAERLGYDGNPVSTLEVGTRPDGRTYKWEPASLRNDGTLDFDANPLSTDFRWRFPRGPLNVDDPPRAIDGVVTDQSNVALRTDNVVVEALLGQADALDTYASALQALDLEARQADTAWRQADTKRTTDALDLVAGAPANKRIESWQLIFPDQPEIQVVPVAAVNNDDNNP